MNIKKLLNRPIAYHRCFVPLGGVTGAVLLSQVLYWTNKTKDSDGWFWKTSKEWEEETGLTRREQETARKRLNNILEEKKEGVPCRLFYRINLENLEKALNNPNKPMHQLAKLDSHRVEDYTETTTKSITKVIQVEEELPQDLSGFNGFLKSSDFSETAVWVSKIALDFKLATPGNMSFPFSVPRGDSKYIKDIEKYISELQNGTFFDREFDVNFKKHELPFDKTRFLGKSVELIRTFIYQAMTTYCIARHDSTKYSFVNRDRTISVADFIYEFNTYNNVLGISHFWKYLTGSIKVVADDVAVYEKRLEKYYENNLQKIVKTIHNNYDSFSEEEKIRLLKTIFYLTKWWFTNYDNLLDKYGGKLNVLFPKKHVSLITRFFKEYVHDKNFSHPVKIFNNNNRWSEFVKWMKTHYEIDFVIIHKSSTPIIQKNEKSEITVEELDKRMNQD